MKKEEKYIYGAVAIFILYMLLKGTETAVVSSKIIPGPIGGVEGRYVGGI